MRAGSVRSSWVGLVAKKLANGSDDDLGGTLNGFRPDLKAVTARKGLVILVLAARAWRRRCMSIYYGRGNGGCMLVDFHDVRGTVADCTVGLRTGVLW